MLMKHHGRHEKNAFVCIYLIIENKTKINDLRILKMSTLLLDTDVVTSEETIY